MIKVGLIGAGTVGSGVIDIYLKNKDVIKEKCGTDIKLSIVCDKNISKIEYLKNFNIEITDNFKDVLNKNVDIVVELIGGITVAKEIITSALEKRKHVVTANKYLLAEYGEYIFKLAQDKNACIGFEASVGGGIPIIKALKQGLVANNILNIEGILNGTVNFILSKMEENKTFEEALKIAQNLGYAEKEPDFDINGIDSAHKIIILTALAYGKWIKMDNVLVQGISDILPLDIQIANELGYKIKLIAKSKKEDGKLGVRVCPTMVPKSNILSSISNAYNAILVEGDFVGPTLYYGLGAGKNPTASAVWSDICYIAQKLYSGAGKLYDFNNFNSNIPVKHKYDFESEFYIRILAEDKVGVLYQISRIFADYNISIKMVFQKDIKMENSLVPILIFTHEANYQNVIQASQEINNFDFVKGKVFVCPVE